MNAMSEKEKPYRSVEKRLIQVLAVAVLTGLAAPVQSNESDREWGRREARRAATDVVRDTGKAEEAPAEEVKSTSWFDGDHLTGDWKGARTWLEDRGCTLDFTYTGEVFSNTHGGLKTEGATEYSGGVDVTAELDTEEMGGWKGGTFFFWLEHIHGEEISGDQVGDFNTVSDFGGTWYTDLSEYWFKQTIFDERFTFKVGKQDMTEDFATSDYSGALTNDAFGNTTAIGFTDYAFGIAFFGKPKDWVTLSLGMWDGGPRNEDPVWSTSGLAWETPVDGEDGFFNMFEAAFNLEHFHKWHPTTLKIGAWCHYGGAFEVLPKSPGFAPKVEENNYGFYLIIDQLVFKENEDREDEQGLGFFFQYAHAPRDRNEVNRYLGGGVAYTGLFPTRDADVLGFGVAHSDFSGRLKRTDDRTYETTFDLTYEVNVNNYLQFRPTFQYVVRPGGDSGVSDAVVAGLRWIVNF